MKYYLETNAVYQLRHIPITTLANSFTSVFTLLELISGINEVNYDKRRVILGMIKSSKLIIDWALPEEIIFNSFDVFDDFEFQEFREAPLQNLIDQILICGSLEEYQKSAAYNSEFGQEYFKSIDLHFSKNFIDASLIGNQEMKRLMAVPSEDKRITLNGKTYPLDTMNNLATFFVENESVNRLFTINALAKMILSKALPDKPSIDHTVESYNGHVDVFVDVLSRYCAEIMTTGKNPAKNDFSDVAHLLYLKNEPNRMIVTNDKIFKRYLPQLSVEISNL